MRAFWAPDFEHPGWGWVCYRKGNSGPFEERVYVPVRIDPDDPDGEFTTLPEPTEDLRRRDEKVLAIC